MARNQEDVPTLVAQTGPLNGERWPLHAMTIVGREESCDIVIPSLQVSRRHARFTLTNQGTLLEDLDSKNGTHCNGLQVTSPLLLENGDVIQIALAQQFLFLSSDATLPLEYGEPEADWFQPQRLRLDKRAHRVWIGDQEVLPPLSVSQFSLLELLFEQQGTVVNRKDLIETVWGEEDAIGVSEQALDALIRRLRDRLAAVDPTHAYLVTVRGHGLRLDNPPTD